ncbi:phosphoglycerate dehydrogenase [Megasphaera vaginalis (ex Bordigoni et al. 2020)]|uniref:phosphoglycerate dehydrogenase n=3 Tax=Megasphaera TaxID=906 RepID=UPI000C79E552|nr:phosphoglycerate dehydrogenase [Megasphaera vaginalis (ex Bordigoni et al. 2020)]
MKTYIFDPISPDALSYAKENLDVITWDDPRINDIKEAEACIVRTYKISKELIDSMPHLRIIAKHGVGTDNIDIPYAKSKKIVITNTPVANSNSVAEQTIALILDCARKITWSHNCNEKGLERNQPMFLKGYEITGKRLGLIGIGHIGYLVGTRLKAGFNMDILAYDPFISKEKCNDMGFQYERDLNTLIQTCDIISISVPLNDSTKNMISNKELSLMSTSTILINTSRGGIVNEEDLYEALQNHQILGAGFDAFIEEPLPAHHKLFTCPNFVGTPHNGANTYEALTRMGKGAVGEIIRFEKGVPTLTNIGFNNLP